MANEIRQKSRATITAQASGAHTAGTVPTDATGGAATTIDNTYDGGSENGLGAMFVNLELDVTSAPSTAATADIYYKGSEDGSTWTAWKYSHTVGASIDKNAARYQAGIFELVYQHTQLKVMANSYGFTSTLYATPKLVEIQ